MTSERRKLVHVFATFGAGGPQIRAVQLMRHLGPRYRHVVMAMDGCTAAAEHLPSDVEVEFVAAPRSRGLPAVVGAQRRWLRAADADLVLTYNWGAIESVIATRS
ncbi:MAG: glycosyltransferase family 1 protein, partial [Planctomycetes bacterium]|nr:glycosyltransferase family 1 protein [Planctomycetota bacterium]